MDVLLLEDPHAVALAAVEEHPEELRVVEDRGDEAGTTREIRAGPRVRVARGVNGVSILDRAGREPLDGLVRRRLIDRREAVTLLRRKAEVSVLHAEGLEDPPLEVPVEPFSGHDLDHAAQDVGREAVLPRGARVEAEGQARELCRVLRDGHVRFREPVGHPRSPVEVGERLMAQHGVGESRRVRQQVPDRDATPHSDRLLVLLSSLRAACHDAGVPELREEDVQRVSQPHLAFLDELQDGDAGDGLRHRADAKDRVGGHGLPRLRVRVAHRVEIDEAVPPGDERDGSRELFFLDVALEHLADLPQLLRGKVRDLRRCGPPAGRGTNEERREGTGPAYPNELRHPSPPGSSRCGPAHGVCKKEDRSRAAG